MLTEPANSETVDLSLRRNSEVTSSTDPDNNTLAVPLDSKGYELLSTARTLMS